MNRTEYKANGNTYAIVNNGSLDSQTPFYVYYNDKLASKFASKQMAQEYIKVLISF